MEFIDEVWIEVRSGKGGDGHVSFRREKFVPHGGPDGGDGGIGGAVVLEATPRRNTLVDYRWRRFHHAEDGRAGGKRQMTGAGGADKVCEVPIGTLVYDDGTGELLADLDRPGARWVLPGGRGGVGNMHFKSSTNQAPTKAIPGELGEELVLRLELKLLADVGLLGFPNAGKSTLLGKVSAAEPRVADYPFTTLAPQLGVVVLSDGASFVMADIPGLIEGAAEGHGLGHQFLRHVERCGCLVHLVSLDPYEPLDPLQRWEAVNEELRSYGEPASTRPQILALNKVDAADADEVARWTDALAEASGARVFPISALTGRGVPELIAAVWAVLGQVRPRGDPDPDGVADEDEA